MKILIHPYSYNFKNKNAKNYPYWDELINELKKKDEITQIGTGKDVPIRGAKFCKDLNFANLWISIDSFLPHLIKCYSPKPGIVIWEKSDPNIFGHKENINILKDIRYLRKNQFGKWNNENENPDYFVNINIMLNEVNDVRSRNKFN